MSGIESLMKDTGNVIVDRSAPPAEVAPKPDVVVVETPAPAPEPVKPDAAAPAPEPTIDHLKIINERFGTEFKSDEEVDTWKTSLSDYPTKLTAAETRMAALEQEKLDLEQSFDPMSLFASKELYALNGLLKLFPDKNPVILSEIATKDFSKSYLENPIDVLALDLMLEKPGVYTSMADAQEDVRAKYDIEDMDEIDPKAKRRMQADALDSVNKFKDLKNKIELPANVDLAARKQEKADAETARLAKMEAATAPLFTKKIPEALKALEFTEKIKDENGKEVTEVAFTYEIGESYAKSKTVQDMLAAIKKSVTREGTEWTPELEARMQTDTVDLLKASYLYNNREQVYAAMRADLETKFKDDAWMKRHNVRPLRQDGTGGPKDKVAEENARKQAEFMKSQGMPVI